MILKFLALIVSLFSICSIYPMQFLAKSSLLKNYTIKFPERPSYKFSKRNLIVSISCLLNKQSNNKVFLLGDIHEVPGINDKQTLDLTPAHTQQMLSVINTIKNKKNSSLFLEASDFTKRLLNLHEQQHGTRNINLISNITDYVEKQNIPYINFDTRDGVDTQMGAFIALRTFYTKMLFSGQKFPKEITDALLTPLDAYITKLKEKKAKTILTIDNSAIPQALKLKLINHGYELGDTAIQYLEKIAAHHQLPQDTPLLNIINILGEYYPHFPLNKLVVEGSFHIDINLLTKILQKKSHLAVALCGVLHTAQVQEYLKLLEYDLIEEQKNGLEVNLQEYTFKQNNKTPTHFLTDSTRSFIA